MLQGIHYCPQHGQSQAACGCTDEQIIATLKQALQRPEVGSTDGLEEQAAAHRYTESQSSRADLWDATHPYPLWHGWALREAFVKGIEWERSRSSNRVLNKPGSDKSA